MWRTRHIFLIKKDISFFFLSIPWILHRKFKYFFQQHRSFFHLFIDRDILQKNLCQLNLELYDISFFQSLSFFNIIWIKKWMFTFYSNLTNDNKRISIQTEIRLFFLTFKHYFYNIFFFSYTRLHAPSLRSHWICRRVSVLI